MRRLLVTALLALLALPAAAQAKELAWAKVCGAGGCTELKLPPADLVAGGDGVPDATPARSPFYTVELHMRDAGGGGGTWTVFYEPAGGLLAYRGESGSLIWDRLEPDALAAYRSVTSGIRPYAGDARGAPPFARAETGDGGGSRLMVAGPVFAVALAAAGALAAGRRRRAG